MTCESYLICLKQIKSWKWFPTYGVLYLYYKNLNQGLVQNESDFNLKMAVPCYFR